MAGFRAGRLLTKDNARQMKKTYLLILILCELLFSQIADPNWRQIGAIRICDSDSNIMSIDNVKGLSVSFGDSPSIDAFSRLRVSNPETIFDSKNIYDDTGLGADVENIPLFFDNQQTSGSGTSTTYKVNMSEQVLYVGNETAGTRIRQTKMRFNYQPGKSQLTVLTFNMYGGNTGIVKREGLFDAQNGIFLELDNDTVNVVRRTYVTGATVDNAVSQSNWNLDPMNGTGGSGITLDFSKTQIMLIDYQWLGVGRVRIGFDVDGLVYYVHEFLNANNLEVVYMSTPNLPIRSEISNDGNGGADSVSQICSMVMSEGGSQDLGSIRYASTAGVHVDMATENALYALIGIRLKSAYKDMTIKILNTAIQLSTASHKVEWVLVINPVITGTFAYVNDTLSGVQIAKGAGAGATAAGGFQLDGGFLESGGQQSGNAGSTSSGINNAIRLGSLIDGTVDEIVLCARPIAGSTNVDAEASLTWRELQ